MENRSLTTALAIWLLAMVPHVAHAGSLEDRIPGLFGGELITSIDRNDAMDAQRPLVAARFRGLSAALATARSQAPVPSASGAFRFAWDAELDTFVRSDLSLGPILAERALTLGRNIVTVGMSYSRVEFDTLEGDSLHSLRSSQPALTEDFLAQLPAGDRMRAEDNTLETDLDLKFALDLIFLSAAYGITDDIDVSFALSVNRAEMRAHAVAQILDPNGDQGAEFTFSQKGVVTDGSCGPAFRCAKDSFSDSAIGTGDLFLRSKWHVGGTEWADFALAGTLTIPTGNADDYLGFHDVTFTPWLIASKSFGRVSPHLNLGYAVRSGRDVSQAQWIAGAELFVIDRLTLATDFLGYHDDNRDGVNDDVFQSAIGFKVNPWGNFVLTGSFQFPLNRDGLRADVIYTGQLEYTF